MSTTSSTSGTRASAASSPVLTPSSTLPKYGITEKKKSELDALTIEVLDAQYELEQYQAMVNSLTDKLAKFQSSLATAGNNRAHALDTKNLFDELIRNVYDLSNNSVLAGSEATGAKGIAEKLSVQVSSLINKLIYSAEIINKLANLIVRKKAMNPLISDELVNMISKAGSDANNAVALTLIALKSTFAATASNTESASAEALGTLQSIELYLALTGNPYNPQTGMPSNPKLWKTDSLGGLLYSALNSAKSRYEQAQNAVNNSSRQLDHAEFMMKKAQVKLNSLQKGLAAGNAAALAS